MEILNNNKINNNIIIIMIIIIIITIKFKLINKKDFNNNSK